MILRQEIFERVVSQLQRIRTTNTYTLYGQTFSYLTDYGALVFPWRAVPFAAGQGGMIVRDLDEPVTLSANQSQRVIRQLHIQVEIVLADDDPVVKLWQAYADVEAALGEGRASVWADISGETRPRITRSVVEQESAKIAGGIVECYIDYPTLAFQSRVA